MKIVLKYEEFEQAVARSIELLPEEFRDRMENISVVVQDYPDRHQMNKLGIKDNRTLLGLYEGVPLTKRSTHYGMTTPDKITIFRLPIEIRCRNLGLDITTEIARVVQHEIAHHFGISDNRLQQIEKRRQNKS